MKFTPFKFQVPLAAGGVALMAFNYLQFAVPHGKGLITLSDIPWNTLTTGETALYIPLIAMMLTFSIINLVFTAVFLRSLGLWLANKDEYTDFMSGLPTVSIGIFVPIASLSMTANVIMAPLGFFIPGISSNLQAIMLPALVFFGFLWLALFRLELKLLKVWLSQPVDTAKLNFVWMLDVFAFGLVGLTGSGIAAMSNNVEISSIAAVASLFVLSVGFFLLITKLAYLIHQQIQSASLPQDPVLPSYFLVVPITCLFGLSFYRIALYLNTHFQFDIKISSFFLINLSYIIAVGWGIFSIYLLSSYFKDYFYKSEFAAPQWAMVWALVGSQVLGVYVYDNYFPSPLLSTVNYVSTVLAAIIFVFVFFKFYQAHKPR